MKKYILASVIIVILLLLGVYQGRQPKLIEIDLPEAKEHQEFIKEDTKDVEEIIIIEDIIEEELVESEEDIAVLKINNINLAVPFTSQAPTANWDQPFQDTCEEASILMAVYYYQNKEIPSKKAVEDIFIEMVDWQEDFMGGDYDITIEETAQLTKGFFNYNTKIIENLTATKIRNLLREGFPVIVPANGHILINHNFTGDGPKYHMLVVKGFVDNNFITNDPGTRNGGDFVYSEANLMEAIADWDKEKALTIGPKVGLILIES